uniref:Uncharacterized protein n=1 Tax=Strongyloides papillosus TaxID=174720 RepID=A0A0N5C6X1_STREA
MSENGSLPVSTASIKDSLTTSVEIKSPSTKSNLSRKFSSNLSLDETQYDKPQEKSNSCGCGKEIENMQKMINTFCAEITKNLSIINEKLDKIDRSILEMVPKKEPKKQLTSFREIFEGTLANIQKTRINNNNEINNIFK